MTLPGTLEVTAPLPVGCSRGIEFLIGHERLCAGQVEFGNLQRPFSWIDGSTLGTFQVFSTSSCQSCQLSGTLFSLR